MVSEAGDILDERMAAADRLMGEVTALPELPQAVNRLLAILDDTEADIHEIAEVIKQDMSLAARVLKLANSPFYGFSARVGSVERAVALIGLSSVKNLALGAVMDKVFAAEKDEFFDPDAFWRHSVAAAVVCMRIARDEDFADPEESFTCGLLHDLGRMIESQFFYSDYSEAVSRAREKASAITEEEYALFQSDHACLGAALLRKWHFPQTAVYSTARHHSPFDRVVSDEAAPGRDKVIALLTMLADRLAYPLEPFLGAKKQSDEVSDLARELGLTEKRLSRVIESAGEDIAAAFEAFGVNQSAKGDGING